MHDFGKHANVTNADQISYMSNPVGFLSCFYGVCANARRALWP
jgi:hypothetical protein